MLGRLLFPLDRRQQTLLLTLLSFGGASDISGYLALLPEAEAALLKEKADKLSEIPREKRVPLLVHQLKQLMSFRGQKGLEGIDPSWLIAAFKGESPRSVAIVLLHMPSSLARQITSRLPDEIKNQMPSREELLRTVPLEIAKVVRARFDEKFASMPLEQRTLETFSFRDVLLLNAKELLVLVKKLGFDELALAFIAVGKRALAAFLAKLPPETTDEMMTSVKRVAGETQMESKAAQDFLGKVLKNFANHDELFQKAGLFRLARAVAREDRTFIRQLEQKLPRAHGRVLEDYLGRLKSLAPTEDEVLGKLRDQIVEITVDLSNRGKIDARFGAAATMYEARAS
jgi:hypothetical protein